MKLADELRTLAEKASKERRAQQKERNARFAKLLSTADHVAQSAYEDLANELRKIAYEKPEIQQVKTLVHTSDIPEEIQKTFHEKVVELVTSRLKSESIRLLEVADTKYVAERTPEQYGEGAVPNCASTEILLSLSLRKKL